MKKFILFFIFIYGLNLHAAEISYVANFHRTIRLDKVNNSRFQENSSIMDGSIILTIDLGGEPIQFIRPLDEPVLESKAILLKVTGWDSAIFADDEVGIQEEVVAKVKRTLTWKVKKLVISGATMTELYKDHYYKDALAELEGFKLNGLEFTPSYKNEISDLVCKKDELFDLVCDLSLSFEVVLRVVTKDDSSLPLDTNNAEPEIHGYKL